MGILRDAVEKALKHLNRSVDYNNAEACDALFFGARDILDLGLKADEMEKASPTPSPGNPYTQPLIMGGRTIPNVAVCDLINLMSIGKIPAIKEHRARTGFGLKESKDAIESIAAHLVDFKYAPSAYSVVVNRQTLDNLLLNAGDLADMFKPGNDHLKQAKVDAVRNGIINVRQSSREF